MRAVFPATALVFACHAALAQPVGRPSTDANPTVRIEGDTLTYIGGINAAGLTALDTAVRHLPRGQVTKMLVNSGGGDTKVGIYIGSIIADLKPDLTIEGGCFSSCAVAQGAAPGGTDLEKWLDEAVPTLNALIAEEAALYRRIGLPDDSFAICGVGDRFEGRLSGDQLGWGFSIADMARLGLPPVVYEGPGAYEDSPGFKKWLIRLTSGDCQP